MPIHRPPLALAPERDAQISAEQVLAVRVIKQAIEDACWHKAHVADRVDALAFLRDDDGDGGLSFWIRVLGCDEQVVRERIAEALNGNGQQSAKCAE